MVHPAEHNERSSFCRSCRRAANLVEDCRAVLRSIPTTSEPRSRQHRRQRRLRHACVTSSSTATAILLTATSCAGCPTGNVRRAAFESWFRVVSEEGEEEENRWQNTAELDLARPEAPESARVAAPRGQRCQLIASFATVLLRSALTGWRSHRAAWRGPAIDSLSRYRHGWGVVVSTL